MPYPGESKRFELLELLIADIYGADQSSVVEDRRVVAHSLSPATSSDRSKAKPWCGRGGLTRTACCPASLTALGTWGSL